MRSMPKVPAEDILAYDNVIKAMGKITCADTLLAVNKELKARFQLLQAVKNTQALVKFHVGQKVTFTGRRGVRVTGTITKIMQKNIKVKQDDSYVTWRVSPNLLQAA